MNMDTADKAKVLWVLPRVPETVLGLDIEVTCFVVPKSEQEDIFEIEACFDVAHPSRSDITFSTKAGVDKIFGEVHRLLQKYNSLLLVVPHEHSAMMYWKLEEYEAEFDYCHWEVYFLEVDKKGTPLPISPADMFVAIFENEEKLLGNMEVKQIMQFFVDKDNEIVRTAVLNKIKNN